MLSLNEMELELDKQIKSNGKSLDKDKLSVLEKCVDDINRFRAGKGDIRKKVDSGAITVDEGCKHAA